MRKWGSAPNRRPCPHFPMTSFPHTADPLSPNRCDLVSHACPLPGKEATGARPNARTKGLRSGRVAMKLRMWVLLLLTLAAAGVVFAQSAPRTEVGKPVELAPGVWFR